jgi:hypothetical protein
VADDHGPDDDGIEDSLSPAERIGGALSDWLHGHPRRRNSRFEPVEIVLFASVAGIALIIVAAIGDGFALGGSAGVWDLLQATTGWAQLPVVALILGAALLAWYQNERRCNEFDTHMREDASDRDGADIDKRAGDIEQAMTVLLRGLNRSRLAVACIGILALLTAAAAVAILVAELHAGNTFSGDLRWYSYLAYVAQCLAALIPALASAVIAGRAWTRGSYLLSLDDADEPFEDEPAAPATS